MARSYTIFQYAEQLQQLRSAKRGMNKAIRTPLKKWQKIMQRALIDEYAQSEFGERIWEWRRRKFGVEGGPAVKLGPRYKRPKYPRWSASEQAYIAPLWVYGLAAQIERGGTLRRHVFWGRGSRKPGVVVPRRPVFDRVYDKLAMLAIRETGDAFYDYVKKLDLA